jgi:hypothetical protein
MIKDKNSMMASLERNLPVAPKAPVTVSDIDSKIIKDTEDDYAFARGKLKGLIDKSENALETLIILAQDAEHPRTYEVLSGMLKNTADITEQLLKLQKQRKELVKEDSGSPAAGGTTNTNNIFVGSTSELQKFLRKEKNITHESA